MGLATEGGDEFTSEGQRRASRRRSTVNCTESCEFHLDHGGRQTVACLGSARGHAGSVHEHTSSTCVGNILTGADLRATVGSLTHGAQDQFWDFGSSVERSPARWNATTLSEGGRGLSVLAL